MFRGEIYWIDFGAQSGHVQSGRRPGVIIQNDPANAALPTRLVVPLSSNLSLIRRYPGTLLVLKTAGNGLRTDSAALLFQSTTVDCRMIEALIGIVDDPVMDAIIATLSRLVNP